MNTFFAIIGSVIAVIILVVCWAIHRFYKKVARRCRKKTCGRIDVKRVCKILLPQDESISYRSPAGKWRWFIRRPVKLTFTVCKCGWVELVKIDTDPMSVWHAKWANKFHREQYYLEDFELVDAARRKIRSLYLEHRQTSLDDQASDTPPLSLYAIFKEQLEVIGEGIDGI